MRAKQSLFITKAESTGNSRLKEILKNIGQVEEKLARVKSLKCKKKIRSNKVEVLVTKSYPTLCNPMDYSLPGSSVHGILQARLLEWVAIPFSRGSSQPRDQTTVSALQADSLLSEPPGKPQQSGNTWVNLNKIYYKHNVSWGLKKL